MAWSKAQIRLFLGALLLIGFVALLGALIFVQIPTANADIVKILTGFMGGAFMTMVGFYFGSSEG